MKRIFTVLFCCTLVLSFAQIPTNGLIGGWPFTGNAQDMSTNANHGTVMGATLTTDRFNIPNAAYSFNGTNQYVVMPNAGPTGTVSRSVSFWAKSSSTSLMVGFNYGSPSGGGMWQVNCNYNCTGWGIDNSQAAVIRGNPNINDNNWHHIVAIQNSTVGIGLSDVTFYVDNVLQPNVTCFVTSSTSPLNSNGSFPITIGRSSNAAARFFNGKLDDFYFYDRPLTPAEVSILYNDMPCSVGPNAPGPISGNINVCSGSALAYSVSPVSGATSYTWTLPLGWTGSSTSNSISVVPGSASGQITVKAGNACGQSNITILNVNSIPSPTISVISGTNTICKGNSILLTANGANTYTWNGTLITPSIMTSPTITTNYTVTGASSNGCAANTVFTLNVSPNTAPSISAAGPENSCPGQPLSLGANGASTYTWQPGNLIGFFVNVSPTITTSYTVTGTATNGCTNTAVYTHSVVMCDGLNELNELTDAVNKVYPNPFSGELIIENSGEPIHIEMYNLVGQSVYKNELKSGVSRIDVSSLEKGLYFLRIERGMSITMLKVIKE